MFYHVKDLQFNARVSKPDPRFARIDVYKRQELAFVKAHTIVEQ